MYICSFAVMPNLFVDIETVPDMTHDEYFDTLQDIESGSLTKDSEDKNRFWKFKKGSLSPFDGKVILITYKINNGYTHRLKEWEDGEAAILEKFVEVLVDLQKGQGIDRLKIIGHNILNFDLFFLYRRMVLHKIREEWRLHKLLLKPTTLDLLQVHMPLNKFEIKGLKHDVLAHAYGFQIKETLGSGEIVHYFKGEYDKIIQYSEREFIYPELYAKLKSDGLMTGDRLQESITWYDHMYGKGTKKLHPSGTAMPHSDLPSGT